MVLRPAPWTLLLLLLLPIPAWAQQPEMTRAFDLERRGDYAAAIAAYRAVLVDRPADVSALLGLERSLLPLNRGAGDPARGASGVGRRALELCRVGYCAAGMGCGRAAGQREGDGRALGPHRSH